MEEIVVTARKRDESFQDVPMTVNVFTARADQVGRHPAARRTSSSWCPNMTLVETQNAGNAFVVVRGISQARNSEPSVAVLVDGVLETNPAEFNQELFDIEQIEVLKGPQGALYGRNAIGGAIIIRTKEPGDEFEGRVKLGYDNGSISAAQAASAARSATRVEYRAIGQLLRYRRLHPERVPGEKADPVEDLSGRVRLLCEPSDTFTRRPARVGRRPATRRRSTS